MKCANTMPNAVCQVSSEALARAIRIVSELSGEAVPGTRLAVSNGSSFWAMAELAEGGQVVHVNDGTAPAIRDLWTVVLPSAVLGVAKDGKFERDADINAVSMSAVSMTWLMLHELMHFRFGHLVEREAAALVGRSRPKPNTNEPGHQPLEAIADPLTIRHCFELQCDCEAFSFLMSEVDPTNLHELRRRIAAIVAVLALIEMENSHSEDDLIEHPSTSARFFTLLAQVFQFWLFSEAKIVPDGETSRLRMDREVGDNEIKAFASSLVVPVVNDAVDICMLAGAKGFLAEIGDEGLLFQDIFTAQYGSELQPEQFKTKAGQEWMRLHLINEQILRSTGQRDS